MSNVPTGQIAAQQAMGSPYGNNPLAAQNAYPGSVLAVSAQSLQNHILGGAQFRSTHLNIDVQKVSNGFVLSCRGEQLIAKDLEELQGLFVAQVASMLLEEK
jgi:hypothetical protein